ncbi:ABC-2 type transport system permease protein [Thermocatellispora tengchongensis]|uniref:ABC-2 type transport system permease protein n=1 Tax=Thermocatellispora tengchongensis TaxID=1073253 RepID=A0A840P3E6_9ACTN|nr:ABC transporter permease [Thermocatellispora tengchongensis]MBB5132000.1 ABC-2 type transport system permease protein [Thermocatellispora tengchongensis]
MALVLAHAKYQLLEQIRIPMAVIGSTFFPAAAMLFFVVPFAGDHPVGATLATASMTTFAAMSTSLFTFGIGVAEDRAQPWDPYLRTLPAGPFPRFAGRIIAGLAMIGVSVVPVLIIAAVFTEAAVTPLRLLLGLAALAAGSVPFTLLGLTIGYALPSKAAIAVTQLVFFPMAVGGGLLSSPVDPPAFIQAIAPYLPSRGAVELVWTAVAPEVSPAPVTMVMLAVWTAAAGAAAVWAYRRDEGVRFS